MRGVMLPNVRIGIIKKLYGGSASLSDRADFGFEPRPVRFCLFRKVGEGRRFQPQGRAERRQSPSPGDLPPSASHIGMVDVGPLRVRSVGARRQCAAVSVA
jgi:hypothetical protein